MRKIPIGNKVNSEPTFAVTCLSEYCSGIQLYLFGLKCFQEESSVQFRIWLHSTYPFYSSAMPQLSLWVFNVLLGLLGDVGQHLAAASTPLCQSRVPNIHVTTHRRLLPRGALLLSRDGRLPLHSSILQFLSPFNNSFQSQLTSFPSTWKKPDSLPPGSQMI